MKASDGYPIELSAPDLKAAAGNTGIPYLTTFDSQRPGPHVLVNALTHGNELCGAVALDRLLRDGFDPANPSASRFIDEDFNRLWDQATLDGPRDSVELQRARALRPVVEAADYLLDLHSMQHATEPLMLAGLTDKSLALARRVGVPGIIVRDKGHAAGIVFVRQRARRRVRLPVRRGRGPRGPVGSARR